MSRRYPPRDWRSAMPAFDLPNYPPEITLGWSDDFKFSEAEIDRERWGLFALINDLSDKHNQGAGDALITSTIDAWAAYIEVHFEHEERLMRAVGYPGLDSHIELHVALARRVEEYKVAVSVKQRALTSTDLPPSSPNDSLITSCTKTCSSRNIITSASRALCSRRIPEKPRVETRREAIAALERAEADISLHRFEPGKGCTDRHDRDVPFDPGGAEKFCGAGHLIPAPLTPVRDELKLTGIGQVAVGGEHVRPYGRVPGFTRKRQFRARGPKPFACAIRVVRADERRERVARQLGAVGLYGDETGQVVPGSHRIKHIGERCLA